MAIQAHLIGQGEFIVCGYQMGQGETPTEEIVGDEDSKNPNQGSFEF
jgi:hypothetical protein